MKPRRNVSPLLLSYEGDDGSVAGLAADFNSDFLSMKKTPLFLLSLTVAVLTTAALGAADFHERVGLQLWSLREQTKESTTHALDLAESYGIRLVETAGTGSLTVEAFGNELKARKLSAVAFHANFEALQKDSARVIADAKALGASYVVMPWLPHDEKIGLTAADAHRAAAQFNAWGKACQTVGLKFGWHPHGFEFVADAKGVSPFDIIVRETKPELVVLEMDVFWVYHAGQDPVKLLQEYPGRWQLMHVKDMRKGAATGFSTGSAQATDRVAVGAGQLDWPVILRTAEKVGVKYYFIEDEGVQPLKDIPAGVQYLKAIKL